MTKTSNNAMLLSQCTFQKIPFPWKLHIILDEAETSGHDKIVSWLPNGLGFKIHDKHAFSQQVMPKYFCSNKFKTFQRNLNLWGFQTLTRDPDRGAAFHPCFIRGSQNQCRHMERVRIKKGMTRKQVTLKPTGQVEAPPSFKSAFKPVSHSPSSATGKMVTPTATPPLVAHKGLSPIFALNLSLQNTANLLNYNGISNDSFLMNLRALQEYLASVTFGLLMCSQLYYQASNVPHNS